MGVTYTDPRTLVEYTEQQRPTSSPEERWDPDSGFRATRTLECDWADRLTLLNALVEAYVATTSTGRVFIIGDKYPHRDGCFVRRVSSIEGVGDPAGDSNGNASWKKAILTVEYDERPFDPDDTDDPKVADESLEAGAEYLTIPDGNLYWDQSGQNQLQGAEVPGFLIPVIHWRYAFKIRAESSSSGDIEGIPEGWFDYVGYVNSDTIESKTLGQVYGPETLLYLKPSVSRSIRSSGGSSDWDVELTFAHKKDKWTRFFNGEDADPQPIYNRSGVQVPVYRSTSFADLFK